MNLADSIKEQTKDYGTGGGNSDFFKFDKAGVYKLRILNQPSVLAIHFNGKGNPAVICIGMEKGCKLHEEGIQNPSIKLVTYVIDRNDGSIKLAELPYSLSFAMQDLQQDSDFVFEDFPMPYDVKVTYDPDNPDPKAKYRLTPSPDKTALTEEEKASLEASVKAMTPDAYVEKRKAKQVLKNKGEVVEHPTAESEGINPDDIPF